MRTLLALFFMGSLLSCGEVAEAGDASTLDPDFFNLVDFVAQEKERLAGKSITKTVAVNGVTETKELSDVDWDLELAPFAQSNIDKVALWDGYSVDSFSTCDGKRVTRYTALDSSNFTKLIEVVWSDSIVPLDSLYAIEIDNGFDSYIATTGQSLIWWQGGYSIKSTQEAFLAEERALSIEGVWGGLFKDPCVKQ